MKKIAIKDLKKLNEEEVFLEANICYCQLKCKNPGSFNADILVGGWGDVDYLFSFKNVEIYLPYIRTDLWKIEFNKDGDLEFFGITSENNQKIKFFNLPDYKTEMEIFELTEEEAKKYYYV